MLDDDDGGLFQSPVAVACVADAWYGRRCQTVSREAALQAVLDALPAPSFQRFKELLRGNGVGFMVRGRTPTLATGWSHHHRIRLASLGLREAFWIRAWHWGVAADLLQRPDELPWRFWRALTGSELSGAHVDALRPVRRVFGDEAILAAMCREAESWTLGPEDGACQRVVEECQAMVESRRALA